MFSWKMVRGFTKILVVTQNMLLPSVIMLLISSRMIKPVNALQNGYYCRQSAGCSMKISKARYRSLKTILTPLEIPTVVMKTI